MTGNAREATDATNATDATKDAGEVDLSDGGDPIVDGLQLRDSFMIYKETSIYRMDYIGGTSIFAFNKVVGTSGALNKNCIMLLLITNIQAFQNLF